MFEAPEKRKEFLNGLRAGRINPQMVQKALAEIDAFAQNPARDLVWAIAHTDSNIQQFGSQVFVKCSDPGKIGALMDAYATERRPEAANAYLAALTGMGPDAIFSATGKMINDRNAEVRRKALTMFFGQELWYKQRAQVAALLDDPQPDIAINTLKQVAAKAPRAYAAQMRNLARHDSADMRAVALQTLIGMNRFDNSELFLHRLPCEEGAIKKALFDAVVAFIKAQPTEMTGHIVKAMGASDTRVSKNAMDFFVKLPDKRTAIRKLLHFTDSTSSLVRDQIFSAAAKQAEGFVDPVLELVKNETNSALRLQALHLAKALKHPKLAPVFIHELKNPDWMVRYSAMQTLGEMKSQQALPILIEALNQPETSNAAIQALDKFGDVRLAKPLFQKLPKASEGEQIEIIKAIRNMNDARMLNHLGQFLSSAAPKGKAKLFCAETIIDLCNATNTAVPPAVSKLHESLREKGLNDLPDLGLKLSDE